MTKDEILASLPEQRFEELVEIATTAQAMIDEEKAKVLAQAQQMGLVKPRKPRTNSKHAESN